MAPADAGNARLFGQGADGTWDSFIVTTIDVRVQGGPGRAIALDELHVDARLMIAAVLVYVEGAIHGMRVQRNGGVQVSNAALTVVLRSAFEGAALVQWLLEPSTERHNERGGTSGGGSLTLQTTSASVRRSKTHKSRIWSPPCRSPRRTWLAWRTHVDSM